MSTEGVGKALMRRDNLEGEKTSTMKTSKLGQLERVDLRNIWETEASSFGGGGL